MKKLAKVFAIVAVVFALAFAVFYFWASSGRLSDDELSSIRRYDVPEPEETRDTFVVVTYNIGYLSGMSNNRAVDMEASLFEENEAATTALVRSLKPDLIALQEIDLSSARSYHVDQVDVVAEAGEFSHAAVAINWDKRYVPFPYWPPAVHFGEMLSGQAIVSRGPILSTERHVLSPPEDAPFYWRAFYLDRLAQVAVVDLDGRELTVINVHLEAFDRATRQKQAEEVLELYHSLSNGPVLLLGDFNSVPPVALRKHDFPDEPETDFRGDDTMRLFLEEPTLSEAFPEQVYHLEEMKTYTFPSDHPSRRLDYIFFNHEKLEPIEWRVVREAGLISDHLPVMMTFAFK